MIIINFCFGYFNKFVLVYIFTWQTLMVFQIANCNYCLATTFILFAVALSIAIRLNNIANNNDNDDTKPYDCNKLYVFNHKIHNK